MFKMINNKIMKLLKLILISIVLFLLLLFFFIFKNNFVFSFVEPTTLKTRIIKTEIKQNKKQLIDKIEKLLNSKNRKIIIKIKELDIFKFLEINKKEQLILSDSFDNNGFFKKDFLNKEKIKNLEKIKNWIVSDSSILKQEKKINFIYWFNHELYKHDEKIIFIIKTLKETKTFKTDFKISKIKFNKQNFNDDGLLYFQKLDYKNEEFEEIQKWFDNKNNIKKMYEKLIKEFFSQKEEIELIKNIKKQKIDISKLNKPFKFIGSIYELFYKGFDDKGKIIDNFLKSMKLKNLFLFLDWIKEEYKKNIKDEIQTFIDERYIKELNNKNINIIKTILKNKQKSYFYLTDKKWDDFDNSGFLKKEVFKKGTLNEYLIFLNNITFEKIEIKKKEFIRNVSLIVISLSLFLIMIFYFFYKKNILNKNKLKLKNKELK